TVRPVTAEVFVEAPVAVPLNFTIRLKNAAGATESSATIRAAVEAELEDLIRRDAEPGGTILFSRIREAISTAAGEFDHSITVPAADITHDDDEIATMGTITWSA
ncbi:MAG TPA: baseplate J/gp47 family protein, partial [Prosthecobacter sp.]|nr:baseplate J/gp47 family protein [Prosthecobacter sp.]